MRDRIVPRVSINLRSWLIGGEYACDNWLYIYIGPIEFEWWVG
jgi:hypothetical protein